MKNIGIMTAMKEEVQPLLSKMKGINTIELLGNRYFECRYHGKEVVLVYSKIGKVNATIAATVLLEKFKCDTLLFSGVAGGLTGGLSGLEIGDIVISDRLAQHDVDLSAFGHPKGHIPETGTWVETSEELREIATTINPKAVVGNIISGDKFVESIQEKRDLQEEFQAVAVEMEGAAVALVARQFEIPCLIIRSISDTLDDGPQDFNKFLETSAQASAEFCVQMIEKI